MKTWDEIIKKALEMFLHSDTYAYFYGAKGQVLTDNLMEYLWNTEPEYFKKYTDADKKRIFAYSRGKIGYDCSGFIGYLFGDMTWSAGIWEHCYDKTDNVYEGVAGSVVYKPGHIGVDIGYGYYLHMPSEMHSVCLGRFKENTVDWKGSGKHRYIVYTGADNR